MVFGSPSFAAAERAMTDGESKVDDPIVWWNWTGAFSKMGSLVFALNCAPVVLHSYSAMGKRTERFERKNLLSLRWVFPSHENAVF